MYSVVLAVALTAGGQTADCHRCWASCAGSCYGSCYGNYGIDYPNCCGNGYGNGYGYAFGACHGCWGGFHSYSNCWGGYSCCGSGYPWDWSSYGCNGCWGTYGEMSSPYFVQPPPGVKQGEPIPPPKKPDDTTKPPESMAPTRARLIVEVPADAKLFIDDHAMKTSSEHRAYQTPDLEPGQTYYYEVRVEVERDGKMLSETKRVLVRAGQEAHADFSDMAATATAKAK
jgi:uncharacterized protein (TIGR03000 family)